MDMSTAPSRRSFSAFHFVLGIGILWLSVRTVLMAVGPTGGHHNPHVAALGAVEAIGALLFLIPRTVRMGAVLLLLTIGIAAVVHAFSRELRVDLLIYAAGVWLVADHAGRSSAPAS
jgi:uncharacterized membrane protein YphA (DoxX/SURF4 family)